MDFDYTVTQMIYLLVSPRKVYQLTSYRKRTKGIWARDDPAFIVIQALFLSAAGWAYGICFGESTFDQFRTFVFFILFHFLLLGAFVSTVSIVVADRYLRKRSSVHAVKQSMEWLYSFDVHVNSFFPFFLLTYVIQYFLLPFLYSDSTGAVVTANFLHSLAICYYFYITTLGYNTLPFIERSEVFMVPAAVFILIAIVMCLAGVNLTVVFVEWTTGVL
jgi:hypothetical protein